jgi:hypothetical protein
MSMNAVSPPRKLPRLGPESRIFRRGVVGDSVDGRSREGRFLLKCEAELLAQLGPAITFTQRMLVRRLSRGLLRLELLDEKAMRDGTLTDHDGRVFGGLTNAIRLISRELGLKTAPAAKPPDLGDYLASKAAAE